MNSLLRSQSIRSESRLQDDYFAHAKENCKWRQKHIKTLTVFLYKNEAEFKQRKGVSEVVPMLVKGCKNRDQNRAKDSKEPQLHKATLVQRKCNTVSLTFSAGSLHGTCVEMQTAFTVSALKGETLVSLGFRVIKCSKINCFRPNQKHKQGINRGMLWKGTKDYHKDQSNHLWI